MQTHFTLAQLADPDVAEANKILRACVHCGFCLATCPTYVLLGDELDSPRGRIYLIKDMLETGKPASSRVTLHIDRCLSCLSCMTTCPSSVHYMHLVDQARKRIEETYVRPLMDRLLRALLAWLMPNPARFRLALLGAWFARPFAPLLRGRLRAMLALAPGRIAARSNVDRPQVFAPEGPRRARVALMTGCAQQVLSPQINEATVRLLTRHGVEVRGRRGCGLLRGHDPPHGGARPPRLHRRRANVAAWSREAEAGGAGRGHHQPLRVAAPRSRTMASCCAPSPSGRTRRRISPRSRKTCANSWTGWAWAKCGAKRVCAWRITPPAPCSTARRSTAQPKALLGAAGFAVSDVPEGHLCCRLGR